MPNQLPKTLQRFAGKIEDISDVRVARDGFWIYLKRGWKDGSDPLGACHQVHENTITECASCMRGVLPCDCNECAQ
jgi:hypothetical protein